MGKGFNGGIGLVEQNNQTTVYDVVVVGGGIAGLVTAWRCQQQGLTVKVLEARDRLGGRAFTKKVRYKDGLSYFDFGAHFIGHESYQKDIWDLTKELGLECFPQYEGPENQDDQHVSWAGQGANLLAYWNSGDKYKTTIDAYVGGIWPKTYLGDAVMGELLLLIEAAMLTINAEIPDVAKWVLKNSWLDGQSVQDWMSRGFGTPTDVIELVDMLCKVGFSAEAKDISMLWFVFYVASSGGLDMFSNIRFPSQGAQGYRMAQGAQSIADALGDRIRMGDPDAITLNTPVSEVAFFDGDSGNLIRTPTGFFAGKRIVLALSPILANEIEVKPSLPAARREAVQTLGHGRTVMTCFWFKEAFWRAETVPSREGKVDGVVTQDINRYGLSGNALVIDGPIVWTMDNVSAEGDNAMFAFVVTDAADNWGSVDPNWREMWLLDDLGVLFGRDKVRENYLRWDWHNWDTDPFSKGCPAAHIKPGGCALGMSHILLDFMPEYQNNQLFFASTEAATISNGYMSGAVWSGKEVAKRVVRSLTS